MKIEIVFEGRTNEKHTMTLQLENDWNSSENHAVEFINALTKFVKMYFDVNLSSLVNITIKGVDNE